MIGGLLMAAAVASSSAASILSPALARAAAAYDAAQAAGNRAALEHYLADDYTLVTGAAEVENKAQLIANFTDPSFKLNPFHVDNPFNHSWPGGAALAGEVSLSGVSGGKPFTAHVRYVDVWRLRSGKWQIIYTQITRFPASH